MRIISLDTETTGLFFYESHRIVEVGCVEILNGKITSNIFHKYVNPMRKIDLGAKNITGIEDNFLLDKPKFIDIVDDLLKFLSKSDAIIIHNAKFDLGFINNELLINNYKIKNLESLFNIIDTLAFARQKFPGKKNNLDSLCERYKVNNKKRTFHGALLDATILAEIYIKMMSSEPKIKFTNQLNFNKKYNKNRLFKATQINKNELKKHENYMNYLNKIDVK